MKVIRNITKNPLIVHTGEFTGRSPENRYFVDQKTIKNNVEWGIRNKSISLENYNRIFKEIKEYLDETKTFSFTGNVCAENDYQYEIELKTNVEWYVSFAENMFRKDSIYKKNNVIKILHAPNFKSKYNLNELNGKNFIIIDLKNYYILIGGTGYAGEIKKAVFSLLNYHLPEQGVLPMHCSANYDSKYGTSIFFGLSGTGKTTLSLDSNKLLIGDDEHGWSSNGIFNIEGGCYAKVIGLNKIQEPEIFEATHSQNAIIENVLIDKNGIINFNDSSITENTRSSYPLSVVKNSSKDGKAPHPLNVVMLTCDAFGVLPAVSKLTIEQALFHFVSGYTAKIPGTETNIIKPQATFSACFGAPFMPRKIDDYIKLLFDLLQKHKPQCWLINTGWSGGSYGVGNRIDLNLTRKILRSCITNSFDTNSIKTSKYFNLSYFSAINTGNLISIDPEEKWKNKKEYENTSKNLINLFSENLLKLNMSNNQILKKGHI